jgi:hypothetical protein
MDRQPTRDARERVKNNDEQAEREAQVEVNDLLLARISSEAPAIDDAASEMAQDGTLRPEDIVAGTDLENPLSTERGGLDVFHANELSGIDTGTNFQPASTTDRFGGTPGIGRDVDTGLDAGAFGTSGAESDSPFGPGVDPGLGGDDTFDNDDYDGSPDGSAPSLPGQATDDPSTMTSDTSGGALDDAILEQQTGASSDDGQAAMREGVREAVGGMTGTSDRDTLERVSALQGAGLDDEISEADQKRVQELAQKQAEETKTADEDGGNQTYSPMDMDSSPGRLRTNDDPSHYIDATPTDIDISFAEAAAQLARAQGPGIGTLIDVPMDGTGNDLGGLNIDEAREDIDPLDPDAE